MMGGSRRGNWSCWRAWGPGLRLGLRCCGGSFKGRAQSVDREAGFGPASFAFRHILRGRLLCGPCLSVFFRYISCRYMKRVTTKSDGGTTQKALLGLLSLGSMSGYDIRALVSWSIGHFWSESYGQIYPALKRLAALGLVEKKTERTKGRPDRHVYSLTRQGQVQLKEWLRLPPVEEVQRNELLLKLFFGRHTGVDVSRAHVLALVVTQESALKVYEAIGKRLRREEKNDPSL